MSLSELLTIAGPLDDQPGVDTGRERIRRLLNSPAITLTDVRELIADAQRCPGDQAQRALADLVLTLGRFLGFEVVHGAYERARGGVRFDGAWRSPRRVRIALEIRIDRTLPFDPADLARTVAALPGDPPDGPAVPAIGLCIVVPGHGSRRSSDAAREVSDVPHVRVVPLSQLLSPAELVHEGRLTHDQVVDALCGDATARAGERPGLPVHAPEVAPTSVPHLSLVRKDDPPDFWIATVVPDEGATSGQVIDAVVRGRHLLPISPVGVFPAHARSGDRVCFYVGGEGVVGFGQFGSEIDRATAPVRGADRFAAILTVNGLTFFDVPVPLDPASRAQRLATRAPLDTPGSFLSPIAEHDFGALTSRASTAGGEVDIVR